MNEPHVKLWLASPLPSECEAPLRRLARAAGVVRVAVLPDVHFAESVCVGVAVATRELLYPQAVGGDIGCGMATLALRDPARTVPGQNPPGSNPLQRGSRWCSTPEDFVLAPYVRDLRGLFDALYAAAPPRRQRQREEWPAELDPASLSDPALARRAERDGRIEFGTLGRGNHFLELQRAEDGEFWLVAHSGSRCMGPAIRDHHLARAGGAAKELVALAAESEAGRRYLGDHAWALRYAQLSRRTMLERAAAVLCERLRLEADWASFFDSHHNLVRREEVDGEELWVHRKGALPARAGERGLIPGSMGDASFHVEGRGCAASLHSSSHGAGRVGPRGAAARGMSLARFARELEGTVYDSRLAPRLLDEAPSAYKPIGKVMRAQRELVRIVRRLTPVLVVKAT